jgi:hypothetical protein
MLRRETLEHGVRVCREPDLERTVALLLPHAVEDHDAARATERDEAGERIDQLPPVLEARRAQEVVAVEQVQGGVSHRDAAAPRTRAAPTRR